MPSRKQSNKSLTYFQLLPAELLLQIVQDALDDALVTMIERYLNHSMMTPQSIPHPFAEEKSDSYINTCCALAGLHHHVEDAVITVVEGQLPRLQQHADAAMQCKACKDPLYMPDPSLACANPVCLCHEWLFDNGRRREQRRHGGTIFALNRDLPLIRSMLRDLRRIQTARQPRIERPKATPEQKAREAAKRKAEALPAFGRRKRRSKAVKRS